MICLVLSLACQTNLFAKGSSDNIKPQWLTKSLPESISGRYIFVRAHGEGDSLIEAKQVAFSQMINRLEVTRKVTINTELTIQEHLEMNEHQTNSTYNHDVVMNVIENGRQYQVSCREIDDYYEVRGGVYQVDILYTVATTRGLNGSYDDKIEVTSRYGAAGFLSIVPGVGQIYKGSTRKGALIIAGEVAALGGVLLCEETRASYVKKMYEQPKYASEYNSLANTWETGRNICIGAAAAIYVVNLIDAFAADGAKRVIVKKNRANVRAVPYYDSRSFGAAITMNF